LRLESTNRGSWLRSSDDEWRGPSQAWLITGAVIIGLGFLMWAYLGPDLRRYMKIHSM
jgi:hypothetical protein